VARRLDWEGAARRDYVSRHGSVPAWVDLPKPKPEQTKFGMRLKGKAQSRCDAILKQFESLTAEQRASSLKAYRERVKRACEEVRNGIRSDRARFASVVDAVERSSLSRLDKLRNPKKKRVKNKQPQKQSKQRSIEARRPLGLRKPSERLPRPKKGASSDSKQPAPAKKRTRHPKLSPRPIKVDAGVALGTLYASWPSDEGARQWRVVALSRDRKLRKMITLPGDVLATEVRGLRAELGPYELKVIGLGKDGPVAVGRVPGMNIST
jgi:hypothetical protein